jgi:hypothetical protein
MDDRHTCKLCFRRFHNGRALGGHMRSHVMAAAAAAYLPASPPISLVSTSSTEVDDGKPTQPEPKQCFMKVGESSIVQDGQSDTESSQLGGGARFAVSRRRSKRTRRPAPPAPDPEPASSLSDATTEEDVAMSLVMLSRDSWARSSGSEHDEQHWAPGASSEPEQKNDDVSLFSVGSEDDHVAMASRPSGRFQCGACRKVFRSYQALGGHRASMKKGKGGCVPPVPPIPPSKDVVIHECPHCFRVFQSGQALDGHKRAHMASPGASPSPAKRGDSSGSIDLNVSAATDDDQELSAVYDAEFGSATRQ